MSWSDPEGGGGGKGSGPPENYQNIGLNSNTDPDPLKKHKASKPGFYVWHHRHASETPFKCWLAYCGIWILSPVINYKRNVVKVGPHLAKLSGSAYVCATK